MQTAGAQRTPWELLSWAEQTGVRLDVVVFGSIAGIVVYVVLGTFAMATLGMAVTAFTPTAEAPRRWEPLGAGT